MFDNNHFNDMRREAEITSVEFADFTGVSRKFAIHLETGREYAGDWAFSALAKMIAAK